MCVIACHTCTQGTKIGLKTGFIRLFPCEFGHETDVGRTTSKPRWIGNWGLNPLSDNSPTLKSRSSIEFILPSAWWYWNYHLYWTMSQDGWSYWQPGSCSTLMLSCNVSQVQFWGWSCSWLQQTISNVTTSNGWHVAYDKLQLARCVIKPHTIDWDAAILYMIQNWLNLAMPASKYLWMSLSRWLRSSLAADWLTTKTVEWESCGHPDLLGGSAFPPVYLNRVGYPATIPEKLSVYACTALLQVLEALYGFYTGCGTNTVIILVVHPQEMTD